MDLLKHLIAINVSGNGNMSETGGFKGKIPALVYQPVCLIKHHKSLLHGHVLRVACKDSHLVRVESGSSSILLNHLIELPLLRVLHLL